MPPRLAGAGRAARQLCIRTLAPGWRRRGDVGGSGSSSGSAMRGPAPLAGRTSPVVCN